MAAAALISPDDVESFLDAPRGSTSTERMNQCAKYGIVTVSTFVRFDPTTLPAGHWKRLACEMVAVRVAARLYTNPLDASNVSVNQESSSWSANSIVGPRLLTDDEREQLAPVCQKRAGSVSTSGLVHEPFAIEDSYLYVYQD